MDEGSSVFPSFLTLTLTPLILFSQCGRLHVSTSPVVAAVARPLRTLPYGFKPYRFKGYPRNPAVGGWAGKVVRKYGRVPTDEIKPLLSQQKSEREREREKETSLAQIPSAETNDVRRPHPQRLR